VGRVGKRNRPCISFLKMSHYDRGCDGKNCKNEIYDELPDKKHLCQECQRSILRKHRDDLIPFLLAKITKLEKRVEELESRKPSKKCGTKRKFCHPIE